MSFSGSGSFGSSLDARRREQPSDALLREVLHAAAVVPGPFVGRRLGIVIHRHKGQLVKPGGDVALGVHVAARSARAEGNAQNAVLAQRHRARQRGDLAIVHNLQGDVVPGLPDFEKQIPDALVEHVGRHPAEERGDLDAVIHINARGAAADGIHPRQMGRRLLQRIHDAVVVILGIGLEIWVPHRFLAENHLAVHDGRHLAVAAPEVEADAAAVQVPAQRSGAAPLRRQGLRMHHLDGVVEHPLAHEVRIKLARSGSRGNAPPVSPPAAPARQSESGNRPATRAGTSRCAPGR